MNILPKKSWHVRNKDNVARVRRDEAEAAEEERKRRKRAELAEQEARTDFLRKKAALSLPESASSDTPAAASREAAHPNFFQEVEDGGSGSNRGNREYEEEKRQEKERQEKAWGVLTYLGQSASEAQLSRPWYQEAPTRHKEDAAAAGDSTKQKQLKDQLDPLRDMQKYRKHKEKTKSAERKRSAGEERKRTKPSIEQLRQERLKREAAERARAKTLLSGGKNSSIPEQETDERKRAYNSQFNPELARKPRPSAGDVRSKSVRRTSLAATTA